MIIGIDPSLTCTGLAFVKVQGGKLFYKLETIKPPHTRVKGDKLAEAEELLTRMSVITRGIRKKLKYAMSKFHTSPRGVFIELPWQYKLRYGKTNTKSLMKLSLLVGAVVDVFDMLGYRPSGIPSGGGIPKKQAGYDFLRALGFNFKPNRGFDNSDALIVAIFGGWYYGRLQKDIQGLTKVEIGV